MSTNVRTSHAYRKTRAPKLLFVDQHGDMGGGQQISLSLVTHPLFRESFKVDVALPEEGLFSCQLRTAGISVQSLPKISVRNGPKRVLDLLGFCTSLWRQYKWFLSKFDEDKYDAIYTSSPRYLLAAVLACAARNKPLHFHVHCFYKKPYQELFLRILFSSRHVASIFCPSHASLHWVQTRLRRTRNVDYVPNWVGDDAEDTRASVEDTLPAINAQSFKIGIVGRIVRLKGHDIFLEAIRRLLEEEENVEAYIVGAEIYGEGDGFADALRKHYSNDARIHFVGERHPMNSIYRQLSCVAIPSRTEVFGLVAIEAMRMHVPVVVSDIDELPYIVADGKCGLTFKANDVDSLVAALKRLIYDGKLRSTLADAGYERTETMYNRGRSVALIAQRMTQSQIKTSIMDLRI